MEYKEIKIKEEFIKLDSALKYSNMVSSGGQAKIFIKEGKVTVNGEICFLRGKKLYNGDTFIFENKGFVIKNDH